MTLDDEIDPKRQLQLMEELSSNAAFALFLRYVEGERNATEMNMKVVHDPIALAKLVGSFSALQEVLNMNADMRRSLEETIREEETARSFNYADPPGGRVPDFERKPF